MRKSFFLYLELFLLGASAVLIFRYSQYKAATGTGLGAVCINTFRKEKAIQQARRSMVNTSQQQDQLVDTKATLTELLNQYGTSSEDRLQDGLEELNSRIQQQISQYIHGLVSIKELNSLSQDVNKISHTTNLQENKYNLLAESVFQIEEIRNVLAYLQTENKEFKKGIKALKSKNTQLQKRIKDLDSRVDIKINQVVEDFTTRDEIVSISQLFQNIDAKFDKQENRYRQLEQSISQVKQNDTALRYFLSEIQKFHQGIRTLDYDLVAGAAKSHDYFIQAIKTCNSRLVIVMPWPKIRVFNWKIREVIDQKLKEGVEVHVGWGWWQDLTDYDRETYRRPQHRPKKAIDPTKFLTEKLKHKYSALKWLREQAERTKNPLQLKLLGTHEKYIIKDDEFALLGSHNFLPPGNDGEIDREMGIRITDKCIIRELVEQYMLAENYDKTALF